MDPSNKSRQVQDTKLKEKREKKTDEKQIKNV